MGRIKNAPKKKDLQLENLSRINEFIPVFPKKRTKKLCSKDKIPYHQLLCVQAQQEQYFLGEIRIGSSNNIIPKTIELCKIGFNVDGNQNFVILNTSDECIVIQALDNINFLKDFVQSKIFSFDIYTQDEYVYFKVYLITVPLPKFSAKIGKCIQKAFELFYKVNVEDILANKSKDQSSLSSGQLNEMYKKLKERRNSHDYSSMERVHPQYFRPKLRPYQEEAVRWMLYRETESNSLNDVIHPLYQRVPLNSGTDVYLDKYTGWIEKDPPLIQVNWKGGILADEMGLGKTVEVLALILSNRFNKDSDQHSDWLSSDDAGDSDDEEQLVIKRQVKKRQLSEDEEEKCVVEKKSKIPEAFVKKTCSRKSLTFQALQSIYDRTLSEYCTTETREKPETYRVQCICGSNKERDCVDCQDCGKLQHRSCLGYKGPINCYKCPQCWQTTELVKSKATLIVAPGSLRKQWCREMRTHLKAGLKVLNYEGYSITPVYPTDFQKYDIVITTYSILQAEMRLTETGQSLNLRNQRKYWPGGSPLVKVQWWRLCLDEAQTVETPTRTVSLMAKKISACHRWAVTGTPIAKGLSDVFGLIDYLQMEPYNDFNTWKYILYDPYVKENTEPMYNFLSKVLWRTSKDSVLDQINIPRQTYELHLLEFSAVEKFFYNREHEMCVRDFLHIAAKFDQNLTLEKMDRRDLKNLMRPLLSLRQACSDPSVVKGKGRYLSLKRNTSSMKDLLEALILKNKNDCEESLRLLVSSINGLAGIYLLMQDPEQAISKYRKVLQLAANFTMEEKQDKIVIDKLPLIHALHNLAEVLQLHPPTEHTLRDGSLLEDCAKLEKQYIEKFMKETASGKEICKAVSSTVEQHMDNFILKHGQWYSDGFDWITLNNLDQDLIARIEIAAANANIDCDLRSDTTRSLLCKTYNWHLDLDESRETLCTGVDALYCEDPETKFIILVDGLVKKAMDCHLRPQQSQGKKKTVKCPICVTNVKLKNYEAKLFTMKKRAEGFEEMGLIGSWKPKFEEILLKAMLGLLRSKCSNFNLIKDGETHILLIEALKKEFKEIRKIWTLLDQQVCAQDELGICKVRLQLDSGVKSKDKTNRILTNLSYKQGVTHENINLLQPGELPHQEFILRTEELNHNARLEILLGTRNYLGTLKQQQFEGSNPDPCPICRGPLVNTWAILSCAHTYCLDCFQALLNKASVHIQCCVCRMKQNLQEIAYIKNGPSTDFHESNSSEEEVKVSGNYSRKVEDVVRLLIKLKREEPQVKVLLFSTWSSILKLLKLALEQNNIKVELADANNSLEKRIESFKDPFKKVTVLLLPIRLGAKGLNLIEATHVVVLEPLLNPADELQAIGRVHRIGQTKPTVVHKFLIRNTIEESLHNATSSNAAGWERGKLTLGQLNILFKNTSTDDNAEHDLQGNTNKPEGIVDSLQDQTATKSSENENINKNLQIQKNTGQKQNEIEMNENDLEASHHITQKQNMALTSKQNS